MAKHFVANSLNRIIDRAIQVHGALGYSTDTPLAHMFQHARWARFADGADEIHQMRIAERTIAAYKDTGSTRSARRGICRSESLPKGTEPSAVSLLGPPAAGSPWLGLTASRSLRGRGAPPEAVPPDPLPSLRSAGLPARSTRLGTSHGHLFALRLGCARHGGSFGDRGGGCSSAGSHGVHVVVADVVDEAGRCGGRRDRRACSCTATSGRWRRTRPRWPSLSSSSGGSTSSSSTPASPAGAGSATTSTSVAYRRAMGINLDGVVLRRPRRPARAEGARRRFAHRHGEHGRHRAGGARPPVRGQQARSRRPHALARRGPARPTASPPTPSARRSPRRRSSPTPSRSSRRSGFPILDVADVVDTFMAVLERGQPGEAWFVIPGRESEPFQFRRAPGPRA